MSHSYPNPYSVPRPGQQSPLLGTPSFYRPRPQQHRANSSMSRTHHHNASITSNPSQGTQDVGSEPDLWPVNAHFDLPAVSSPGSLQPSSDIYNLDEDTSYRESSFDDFLTTEGSSENHLSNHTTPQEQIWEQQFLSQDAVQPHKVDSYGANNFEAVQGVSRSSDLQSYFQHTEEPLPRFVSGEELRSSKNSSSGSPLPRPPRTQIVDQQQNQSMDCSSTPHRRGISQTLKVDTTSNHTPSPNNKVDSWQRTSGIRAPSPVVMISDYETSGVKSETQQNLIPTSAKRGRESESSDDDDDDDDDEAGSDGAGSRGIDVSPSRLMPPDANNTDNLRATPSQRRGFEPQSRNNETVTSAKELEEQRKLEERNADVQEWLATSEASNAPEDGSGAKASHPTSQGARRRAHTTEGRLDALGPVYSDQHIPGPGALVDEESDDEYFDEVSVHSSVIQELTEQTIEHYRVDGPPLSPHTLAHRTSTDDSAFPPLEDQTPGELEPLPTQFIRRGPWQDAVRGPVVSTRGQPDTSNAAAYKYNEEAAKWETASRAATWGTRRRLSESEINSIVEGSQIRHLSLSKRGRERTSSLFNKARGIFPRRSSSNIKEEPTAEDNEAVPRGHSHRSSVGSIKPQRMPSFGKPKSPPLNTGSALLAMTGQLAAVGRGNSVAQDLETSKSTRPLQTLKKQRSKSDVTKNAKSSQPGLADLLTKHGGPPIPTLASPMHEREPILAAQVIDNEDAPADDEEDETDEVAIKMDLEIRVEDIRPTIEGFRDHARKLNPRLEPYLLERIGQEQIRRYKKLVENKIKHTRYVQVAQRCASGKFCFDLGGQATPLAPRVSSKDPDTTLTQFQISNPADDEVDESGFTDGVVTPALFPLGIPLPPVPRLPAEFECNLCFKVKKFHKPSDWTKHVHEDIQPFSCTFPNCTESKSFKRKADWVRHENERHRHLEWWQCSIQECNHVCYRKDNFVQHLVREHKMTEPKVKRGSGSSKNKAINNGFQEDSDVWRMVDECRFQTDKNARDEACRFCGNHCSTFKKLSVHMGRHMEQIALPVLQLVSMTEVSPDTIVSPIDQPPMMGSSFGTIPGTMNNVDGSNLSPYPVSATSAYQTSSAGQSPASLHVHPQNGGFPLDQGYYSPHALTPTTQGQVMTGGYGATANYVHQSPVFMGPGQMQASHQHSLSPQNAMAAPRSQPMGPGYDNSFYDSTGAMYTQASMQNMYVSAHSHPQPISGYSMGQYASSMLPSQTRGGHASPMEFDGRAGLGLQTGLNAHTAPSYVYGAPGAGETSADMHFA
ncbi:uncharacterized protein Z520_05160 [Fonsecaea multimorphosa CBS 102226]|uniref:C2H2-type domain-containing protein n=1 Tax=Fonsecaea multimorphosa CBS 102226 TaxID=1442371 RepID=A0A0D2H9Y3_9EURO|nr:uncharacterized protein Z520_05160 [Fonsecaea multimorphosa CBS 102226]KIX98700.1 hypothetical protein Z520_05160 [Fonsecaea multimorphosa CBS 102226]OAL32960.1 hypothetical protein AYO22_00045 [Fonsecaea multimorphosa]